MLVHKPNYLGYVDDVLADQRLAVAFLPATGGVDWRGHKLHAIK